MELERRGVSETRSTVAKHTREDNVNCSVRQRLSSCYKRAYRESTQLPGIQGGRGALHPNQGNGPTTAYTVPDVGHVTRKKPERCERPYIILMSAREVKFQIKLTAYPFY